MAIYHLHAKIISRSSGQSAVASSAYRSGEILLDERLGQTFDYTKKGGIVHTEIMAPENAPDWMEARKKLWNGAEAKERRKDAQIAREVEVALPRELSKEQNVELVREFVKDNFVSQGMVADIAIHESAATDGEKNPHAHIMLTMREVTEDGFANRKNRDWNKTETLEQWREKWAEITNRHLEMANVNETIDHRTLEAQGIDREPGFHLGHEVSAMERKGILTDVGDRLRRICSINRAMQMVTNMLKWLGEETRETYERFRAYNEYMEMREQGRRSPRIEDGLDGQQL